jgi:phage terminase large subunit
MIAHLPDSLISMAMGTSKPTLNPCLRDFWRTPARNRVLHGGRASSKSWDAGGFAVFLADNYKLRILCTRQFQNRIEESVYALLKLQIERFGLSSRFDVQNTKIYNTGTGTEFMFYGLWRHINEIKSLEDVDILWIEEAHNLTEEQWKVLEPTIRKKGSQIWIIFNPQLATDFAYKRFVLNPPPNTIVRQINYDENPFLSDTMLKIIDAARLEDPDEFDHIYGGQPKQDDDSVIIKRSWIMASIDAHKVLDMAPTGRKRIGFDIADSGADKCATVYAHGSIVSWADMWKAAEDELLKSCTRVYHCARERDASITYDSIGVGASAGAKFGELNMALNDVNKVGYSKFNAGGAVFRPESLYEPQTKNKDMFSNIKAQAWWLLADRFRNTYNAIRNGQKFDDDELISLSSELPHLDLLIDELSTPKRDYDQNGRVKVESKKDLAKREVASPNLADAIVMAFALGAAPMKINHDLLRRI